MYEVNICYKLNKLNSVLQQTIYSNVHPVQLLHLGYRNVSVTLKMERWVHVFQKCW